MTIDLNTDFVPRPAGAVPGVMPALVQALIDVHVIVIRHKLTVAMDDWCSDLALIADAMGWPPGETSRNRVAAMIGQLAGVTS